MRKLSILFLVLAIAAAAAAVLVNQWVKETDLQRNTLEEQLTHAKDYMGQSPELWTNQAAEEALAYRPVDSEEEEAGYEFLSPEGILFLSDSDYWDEDRLEELYEELLRNRHGDELNTLDRVMVHAKDNDLAAATHPDMIEHYPFRLHYPLFSDLDICSFTRSAGKINLYGGDKKTTVESMAADLSHEYGHHFTMSYLFTEWGAEADLEGAYAKLRNLDPEEISANASSPKLYRKLHSRILMEIAAEDYVVLMGSPNAMKQIGDYTDIRDQIQGKKGEGRILRNAAPQENMFLPFATQVPGLADYFYGFIGEKAPEYPDAKEIQLKFERHTGGFRLISGYPNYVSYEVTWNKALGDDAVYTLVCMDPETEQILPLATVQPGEEAVAEIGTISFSTRSLVTWYSDGLNQGTKRFLVVVTLPDGRVAVTEPVEQSF